MIKPEVQLEVIASQLSLMNLSLAALALTSFDGDLEGQLEFTKEFLDLSKQLSGESK